MDYTIVELPERTVAGLRIRTANDSPSCTADIGGLWQRIMEAGMYQSVPGAAAEPYPCFALYYGYDMASNEYDLLIGCETSDATAGPERQAIPAGRYAKVEIRDGDCVESVQKAWMDIWADEELTAQRAFTVDFEAYLPGEDMACADIDIFVALGQAEKR